MTGILALTMGVALAGAAPPAGPEAASMDPSPAGRATVEHDGARLDVTFDMDAPRRLRVRYRLHNSGETALAVFDRGDTLAVAQGRLTPGTVGAPATEQGADGLSLQHRAVPLRRPAPTVPPIPLAA